MVNNSNAGIDSSESVWCKRNGSITLASCSELFAAKAAGRLGEYSIGNVSPKDMSISWVGIPDLLDNGSAQMVKLTTVTGRSVTLPIFSYVLDISNVHSNRKISHPMDAFYLVGGTESAEGEDKYRRPGNSLSIQVIEKYELVGTGSNVTFGVDCYMTGAMGAIFELHDFKN